MKKILKAMLTIIMSHNIVYALPVGNPGEASLISDGIIWDGKSAIDVYDQTESISNLFSVRLGFYGDFVFDRKMKTEMITKKTTTILFDKVGINTKAAILSCNLWNCIDVFGTFGYSQLSIKCNRKVLAYSSLKDPGGVLDFFDYLQTKHNHSLFEYQSNEAMSWSAGLRATVFEASGFSVGLEGQYFKFSPTTNFLVMGPFGSTYRVGDMQNSKYLVSGYPIVSDGLSYQDWQVGCGVSYRINMLAPYLAIKWSSAQLKDKGLLFKTSLHLEADYDFVGKDSIEGNVCMHFRKNNISNQNLGYVAGVTIFAGDSGVICLEGRLGSEKALSIIGQVRF